MVNNVIGDLLGDISVVYAWCESDLRLKYMEYRITTMEIWAGWEVYNSNHDSSSYWQFTGITVLSGAQAHMSNRYSYPNDQTMGVWLQLSPDLWHEKLVTRSRLTIWLEYDSNGCHIRLNVSFLFLWNPISRAFIKELAVMAKLPQHVNTPLYIAVVLCVP